MGILSNVKVNLIMVSNNGLHSSRRLNMAEKQGNEEEQKEISQEMRKQHENSNNWPYSALSEMQGNRF